MVPAHRNDFKIAPEGLGPAEILSKNSSQVFVHRICAKEHTLAVQLLRPICLPYMVIELLYELQSSGTPLSSRMVVGCFGFSPSLRMLPEYTLFMRYSETSQPSVDNVLT